MIHNMDGAPWSSDLRLPTAYAPHGANGVSLSLGLAASGRWGGKKWGEVGDGMHYRLRDWDNVTKAVVFVNWREWRRRRGRHRAD